MLKQLGRLFCTTLIDYASSEPKVREAITELEIMFPPPKNEEGLSAQFGIQPEKDSKIEKQL